MGKSLTGVMELTGHTSTAGNPYPWKYTSAFAGRYAGDDSEAQGEQSG